ncbi:MAG: hypothetical protein IT289_07205 [Oligoflexia bacterium]|nr:hypothetical protein [Oligoflexia bacterium]
MRTIIKSFALLTFYSSVVFGDAQSASYLCQTRHIRSWLIINLNVNGSHEADLDFTQLVKDTGQSQLPFKYCLSCTDESAGDSIVFESSSGGDNPLRTYRVMFVTGRAHAYLTISEPDKPNLDFEFICVKRKPGEFITFHFKN